MNVLILCTGNSCRSQMAEGFIKSFYPDWEVYSAGTNPSGQVNPLAVKAMAEVNIDISAGRPEDVAKYLDMEFDYVITVCGNAKESCPVFSGKVKKREHIGFDDPADAEGSEEKKLAIFRRIRGEIKRDFKAYFEKELNF